MTNVSLTEVAHVYELDENDLTIFATNVLNGFSAHLILPKSWHGLIKIPTSQVYNFINAYFHSKGVKNIEATRHDKFIAYLKQCRQGSSKSPTPPPSSTSIQRISDGDRRASKGCSC